MKTQENHGLKDAGLKVTTPRLKILELLEKSRPRHLSVEEVYQRLCAEHSEVGLATVYRVLTQFEAAGLVRRHHFEGEHAVFELEQGEHHDHLVCVKCGRVEEFVDATIEAHQAAIARRAQFRITGHALTIYGTCRRCAG